MGGAPPPWALWGPKGPKRGGGAPHGPHGPQGPQSGLRGGPPRAGRAPGAESGPDAPQLDEISLFPGRAKIGIRPRILGSKQKSRDLANLDPPRAPGGLPRHFCQKARGQKLGIFDELWPIEIFPKKMCQDVPGSQCRPEPRPGVLSNPRSFPVPGPFQSPVLSNP